MIGKKLFTILFIFLISCSAGVFYIAQTPHLRDRFQNWFFESDRIILAEAHGDLTGQNDYYSIVKVKTKDSLSLEVYEIGPEASLTKFINRLVLPEKRDGHFNYKGNATNLALIDVDNDGSLEIVAPTYDENLVPRLRVFKFNRESTVFELMSPESFSL
jgi:hypothetical protein